MEKVTDRASNPFGLDVRCDELGGSGDPVLGYGDPNADFHVIGDHPGRHGGATTGVPFTESGVGERVLDALGEVGLVADQVDGRPALQELYLSYLYPCLPAERGAGDGRSGGDAAAAADPSRRAYDAAERFFDAELRGVNAHVLIPVGETPVRHVIAAYTTSGQKLRSVALSRLHAEPVRGRGFLVVPVADPTDWSSDDRAAIVATLQDVLVSDYRQTKGVATRIG